MTTPGEEPFDEAVQCFLRTSTVYLLSCAFKDSLRAAYARQAMHDPLSAQELQYRELVAREAVALIRAQLYDHDAEVFLEAAGV